jgi:peroxin-6
VDFNLNLSFLLEGGRGSGKFTITSWAAQKLGLHLMEVRGHTLLPPKAFLTLFQIDCYDLLDENLVKTEATLRVRFEQALSCTPCLIVLRHLEALSRTSLYQNTREGGLTRRLTFYKIRSVV